MFGIIFSCSKKNKKENQHASPVFHKLASNWIRLWNTRVLSVVDQIQLQTQESQITLIVDILEKCPNIVCKSQNIQLFHLISKFCIFLKKALLEVTFFFFFFFLAILTQPQSPATIKP